MYTDSALEQPFMVYLNLLVQSDGSYYIPCGLWREHADGVEF
jgi:hypothetical protein